MREIKFRGICNEENTNYYGKWIHGYLGYENSINPIETVGDDDIEDYSIYDELTFINVRPETIGQFTGLHDKNGVEIYEGDKLSMKDEIGNSGIVTVGFENGGFIVFRGLAWRQIGDYDVEKNTIEVIGNIHEEVKNEPIR